MDRVPHFQTLIAWYDIAYDPYVHEQYVGAFTSILLCKYCRWEKIVYDDSVYVREPLTGWWEYFEPVCVCIYCDRFGCNVGDVTEFFVPNTFRVHLCDCPLFAGPRDILDGSVYPWREVISVHSFRCLMLLPIHRWRRRKQKKDKHPLGKFLHTIDWKRARLVVQVYLQDVPWS